MGKKNAKYKTKAHELAEAQRVISVSEFFSRNRHLLGFDNPRKALLTVIKEGVDNALDAAEEARVLPEIYVEVKQLSETRYRVIIEDNGPGIVKAQIPNIFGRLLYGSKFFKMYETRGMQGIGISAAALYGQLTTGKGINIISKISPKYPAHFYEIYIDTKKNEPIISKESVVEWSKDHGTKIEFEIEAKYQKGKQSVDEYLKQTALANPHVLINYKNPEGELIKFSRGVNELPVEPKEIKPHPYGVELGVLIKMLQDTKAKTLQAFLQNDFCRVSAKVAKEIITKVGLYERARPKTIARKEAEALFNAINNTKIIAPPTNCLSPIGEEALLKGMKKEVDSDFYCSVTRSPSVYRGFPFQVECCMAYGGSLERDGLVRVMRFANKVPLLYQPGACSMTKGVVETAWKNYGLSQSRGALPSGPMVVMIHIASVWVPFTSESKEAIAHYPEIIKEIKLALQDCGRKLATHIRKTVKAKEQRERINLFEKYIPELADALSGLSGAKKEIIEKDLLRVLRKGMKELLRGTEHLKGVPKEEVQGTLDKV